MGEFQTTIQRFDQTFIHEVMAAVNSDLATAEMSLSEDGQANNAGFQLALVADLNPDLHPIEWHKKVLDGSKKADANNIPHMYRDGNERVTATPHELRAMQMASFAALEYRKRNQDV